MLPEMLVPLPFVATLLLLILLGRLYVNREQTPCSPVFLALISSYALATILVGLRWHYDILLAGRLLPLVAASLPILAYLGFLGLSRVGPELSWPRDRKHLLPHLVLLIVIIFIPVAIDFTVIAVFCGYCVALLRLAMRGPSALKTVRLEHLHNTHKTLWATTGILLAFMLLDLLIALDFSFYQGEHVTQLITAGYIPSILALSFAASVAVRSRSVQQPEDIEFDVDTLPTSDNTKHTTSAEELALDQSILHKLDALMQQQKLYKDENLNLAKLARKCGRPSREISAAVKRQRDLNISRYVNEYRVAELAKRLRNSPLNITQLQLEVGFQTRSNCNREFQRIMGCSPKQWRESQHP